MHRGRPRQLTVTTDQRELREWGWSSSSCTPTDVALHREYQPSELPVMPGTKAEVLFGIPETTCRGCF